MSTFKIGNEYARAFGPLYARTPKAVFAAIAFSFALRLNEDHADRAAAEFLKEWETLHANGIVDQRPPSRPGRIVPQRPKQ